MEHIAKKACISYSKWPGLKHLEDRKYVNPYLGSGRFGGCFDAYGLMNRHYSNWSRDALKKMNYSGLWESDKMANTVFMHADHWSRGNYGLDYHLPVARLAWTGEIKENTGSYSQDLDIYDGRLCTELQFPGLTAKLVSCFNPYNRDIFALQVEYDSGTDAPFPGMALIPETEAITQYENCFKGSISCLDSDFKENRWLGCLSIGTANTLLCLRILSEEGKARLKQQDKAIEIEYEGRKGRHLILFGVAGSSRRAELENSMYGIKFSDDYMEECTKSWHKRWGNSWIDVPDDRYQALWSRSVYYLLCSYSPDTDCVAPPNGWTGNGLHLFILQRF